jgi:hypothetical protein
MKMAKFTLAAGLLFGTSSGQDIDLAGKLQELVEGSARAALAQFKSENLKEDEFALTAIFLRDGREQVRANYRGGSRIYPASVVKLFYLVAAHHWMEQGKISDNPELRRAMKDMIVESSNDAAHYVLDLLTGTTSGPELTEKEMAEWIWKRNEVNRYFAFRGFEDINCNQKPWCEGPYGRERVFVGLNYTNRNALTTDATARLLTEIVSGTAVNARRSAEMLELLERDPSKSTTDADDQAHGFTAPALPPGAKLWSKAGWTSEARHDAALIQLSNGRRIVLVIFTINHATDRSIIPALAKPILDGLNAD